MQLHIGSSMPHTQKKKKIHRANVMTELHWRAVQLRSYQAQCIIHEVNGQSHPAPYAKHNHINFASHAVL